jgi:NAD(P)-dependent dehydrogenase (short-subunit alcohol dehydrogenase family)
MNDRFDLTGKVAVVTGASRGLGKAISLGLAGAGADVVASSRTLSACEAVAKEIEALGSRALPLECDVADWGDIEGLVESTYARFGRCDVLVNNAGITQSPRPLTDTTSEFFDQFYGVNVKGPMRLANLLAPRMGEAGGGSIVNVITMGALKPGGYLGMYCSSKAAMKALTRVMAEEWAPMAVRVNAIAPGPFMTDMLRDLEKETPGFIEYSADVTLQKRVADPDEIVGAVLFLASDASTYVTAQTLSVCGGAT